VVLAAFGGRGLTDLGHEAWTPPEGLCIVDRMRRRALFVGLVVVGCGSQPPAGNGARRAVDVKLAAPRASAEAGPEERVDDERLPLEEERWAGAPEVEIGGGELLGCRGQRMGEWLRVVCAGDDNVFGQFPNRAIVDPTLDRKGVARTRIEGTGGAEQRAVLVFRWGAGRSVAATVTFDDAAVPLDGVWPEGAVEPVPAARFRGIPEVDRAAVARFLCGCYYVNFHPAEAVPACEETTMRGRGTVLECLRAQLPSLSLIGDRTACQGMMVCIGADIYGVAECAPGERHVGACPHCRCAIECGQGWPTCPPGMACVDRFSVIDGDIHYCEVDEALHPR
jgi:hypothetical protein